MGGSYRSPVTRCVTLQPIILGEFLEFLLPREPDRDPGFRQEIRRLARRSLYIVGAVDIGLPLISFPISILIHSHPSVPSSNDDPAKLWHVGLLWVVGLLTIAAARTKWGFRHGRLLASISILAVAAILIVGHFLGGKTIEGGTEDWAAAVELGVGLIFVKLVAVAVLPLRPVHMFALGTSVTSLCFSGFVLVLDWEMALEAFAQNHALHGLPIATLLTWALSGVIYRYLYETYKSHQQTMNAQSQLLLAESSASMGRLAAALSHELNTPAGALKSAVQTLRQVAEKRPGASEEQTKQLDQTETELHLVVEKSLQRLQEVMKRMQRVTGLDRAEVSSVDLNEVLEDLVSLVESDLSQGVSIDLDLQPMPSISARPQQMSAVFSNLLHVAIARVGTEGHVRVTSRKLDSEIEVVLTHDGPGMSASDLSEVFDLGLSVRGKRVAATNWSLFSSRQILREHGGEIRIDSYPDRGTTVYVSLPC